MHGYSDIILTYNCSFNNTLLLYTHLVKCLPHIYPKKEADQEN